MSIQLSQGMFLFSRKSHGNSGVNKSKSVSRCMETNLGCNVSDKVKSIIWRACKNAMPIKTNLVCKKVLAKDVCEHCKQFLMDVIHALWLSGYALVFRQYGTRTPGRTFVLSQEIFQVCRASAICD